MNEFTHADIPDQIERDRAQLAAAPEAFFNAWRRGVTIAGAGWFGDGTARTLQQATNKWDLRPDLSLINRSLGALSPGERLFLCALASFYNAHTGGQMLRRCGFEGLSDLSRLDRERRQVIAELLVHYDGW